jgi:hypothetical protein
MSHQRARSLLFLDPAWNLNGRIDASPGCYAMPAGATSAAPATMVPTSVAAQNRPQTL